MLRSIIILPVLVAIFAVAARPEDAQRPNNDEAAVCKAVTAYVDAFNRGDAKNAASEWAEDGEYVTDEGEHLKGRDAIRKGLEGIFAESRPHLDVDRPSVHFVTPEVATVEGTADVVAEGEAPSESSYIAIFVKQQNKWKLHSIRETALPSPPSHYDQLQELDWMIGHWVDRDENATIDTVCQWTKNKNFITRSFTASIAEHVELEGTQVVGWDPSTKTIRFWLFDSDGGFSEGTWSRDGNRWTIQSRHVLPDGRVGSSTNILTRVDQKTFTWESMGREVGGEMLPNVEAVTIVRQDASKSASNHAEVER